MTKHAKVRSITKLEEGVTVELGNYQIVVNKTIESVDENGNVVKVNVPHLLDMDINTFDKKKSYNIMPGAWRVTPQTGLQPMELADVQYYETDTSKELMRHFNVFMNNIYVYRKHNIAPKRGFLFGSEPGVGKSSLINYFSRQMIKVPNTCILRVDSSEVSYETIIDMFTNADPSKISLIILVLEDIGGSGLEERASRVDPDMLNFLDGNADVFKIPTLVVATTNYLDVLNKTLTSRPGRFDIVREVEPPKDEEIVFLVEKFMGRSLTESEKKLFAGTKMTPAYSKEAVLRHELYDISLEDAVTQVLLQRKKAETGSLKKEQRSMGFVEDDEDY